MQAFGQWLRSARLSSAFSQEKLAASARDIDKDCGIHQAQVTAWELGKKLPTRRQLHLLGLALGLSEEAFKAGHALWEAAQVADLPTPQGHLQVAFEDAPTAV